MVDLTKLGLLFITSNKNSWTWCRAWRFISTIWKLTSSFSFGYVNISEIDVEGGVGTSTACYNSGRQIATQKELEVSVLGLFNEPMKFFLITFNACWFGSSNGRCFLNAEIFSITTVGSLFLQGSSPCSPKLLIIHVIIITPMRSYDEYDCKTVLASIHI